jgi:glycosyltransferase involved in cell wall biosynthesis
MITLIVPTRNRAHTLRLVAPSYFEQDPVSELVFVDDAGEDDTLALIGDVARRYPRKTVRLLRNHERLGASQSRNVGVAASSKEFILFCDDDEYLEAGYARILLDKLQQFGAAAISGRRIYLQPGESREQALRRFGHGLHGGRPFRALICEYANGARFEGDLRLPITNAIILTRRELLLRYPFDAYYAHGNGYREETDYQMNLYVNGLDVYTTNACHSFHLPLSQVRGGGQRTQSLKRIYWSIYYTNYFFAKFYRRYAARAGLSAPRWFALFAFSVFAVYREVLRPFLYRIAMGMLAMRTAATDERAVP